MILSLIRLLTRHYPFQYPRESLLRRLPEIPRSTGIIDGKKGIKYPAYTSSKDNIVKNLFWFGNFEPWVISMIRFLAQPGEVICDIGANIGDTTLQIFPYFGPVSPIYCFEPLPFLKKCIDRNLKENQISSVTVVPKALSNSTGTMSMAVESAQPGRSRITKDCDPLHPTQEHISVEVITFDEWLSISNISQVAVCKVDVEGHELEVFEGMKNSLDLGIVGSIVFERHAQCNATDPVVKLLRDNHYRVFRIFKGFFKTVLLELPKGICSLRGTADYVAVHKGSIFENRIIQYIKD